MTNPQHEALVEELRRAAKNVELTRMRNTTGYLAGWEHLTMRKAADAIAALSATAATPSDEEVRLASTDDPVGTLAIRLAARSHCA